MYLNNLEIPIEFQDHSQGHMGFGVFFCVPQAVATHGQYWVLIRAWWSCLEFLSRLSLSFSLRMDSEQFMQVQYITGHDYCRQRSCFYCGWDLMIMWHWWCQNISVSVTEYQSFVAYKEKKWPSIGWMILWIVLFKQCKFLNNSLDATYYLF